MNKDMLDLAALAIETAKAAGADACRRSIDSDRRVEISYRERKPETIKEASTRDLQIALYVDGRYSAQGTSDLRPDALKRSSATPWPRRGCSPRTRSARSPTRSTTPAASELDLGLVDPRLRQADPADRHQLAKAHRGGVPRAGRRQGRLGHGARSRTVAARTCC